MKIINSISRVMNYVAMALVLILMMLTVSDVLGRFFFNSPITGTSEMAGLIMVSLVLGVSWCAMRGGHISVDLVMKRFSPRVQTIVDIVTLLSSFIISTIITWRSLEESLWDFRFNATISSVLLAPTFPFRLIYTLGVAMLCVVMIVLVIQKVQEVTKS